MNAGRAANPCASECGAECGVMCDVECYVECGRLVLTTSVPVNATVKHGHRTRLSNAAIERGPNGRYVVQSRSGLASTPCTRGRSCIQQSISAC